MNILFVCRGNLCRSPLAEGLLKKKFADNRINGEISSAGFETFHINEPPHQKAIEIGEKYGISLSGKARLFTKKDFIRFDKIYVMDELSYHDVLELASTKAEKLKVDYLMNVLNPGSNQIVPDPLYSGVEDFESIYSLLEEITEKMIKQIK
jgi:protein-tyrosine phosphatase